MATPEEHLQELLKLPVEERARLAELLLESLDVDAPDPQRDPLRAAELARRIRSIEDGTAEIVDADEVRRQIHARLSALRRE